MSIEATNFLFKELARVTGMPDPTAPYQPHSVTSREAAENIRPNVNKLQSKVYEFIYERGLLGATDQEIQTGLDMNGSTQRPRRVELHIKGMIQAAGSRKSPNGRNSTVWVAKEFAHV